MLRRNRLQCYLWLAAGCISLALGIIGIVLPLLPTTPFLLLAAFCFARGSEKLHSWLVNHPRLGPPIRDWETYRAISKRGKVMAMIAIVAVFVISILAGVATYVIAIQAVVLSAVSIFILTRPHPPHEKR
ncbi:YbaN family protein [Hoeflea poritis]|uniref:YbaN family protein n=1 Tax=Hoeflea poritis TaxID=2993659 RepID=A0ABT4VL23_9HYPH|nr:YbaN family protein [Hoeflea poritis]MDA4845418.1 YbaN family protein [Hoeflea poritis]